MDYIRLLKVLEFSPKENVVEVLKKNYPQADDYCIEIDLEKQTIDFGEKIQFDTKTTQNFSQPENFVVLECVNRLLEKGYKPENIILEKTWGAGHGTSGRLDICVNRDDGSEYLLIECKTYGREFDKEFTRMKKDGGQLFTYFKFSNKADVIMLYASELKGNEIVYRNEIIKIEDDYRTGDVKDFYNRWDKQVFDRGIFEKECEPYNLQPKKKITILDLEELTADKGQTLFNQFAEILRRHSVSDKPNAFSVIFNLFLAKIWDEHKAEDEELEFQWNENDDAVDFQVTLHNLHKEGLKEFLKKEMDGIYNGIFTGNKSAEEIREAKKKFLKINSVFAIKNVIDDADFERNHRVLVEVVKMLQKYRIKYPRKQKYLSEFFERLLTVGLKQEVGQYFTPPPITKFIVKSLPLPEMIKQTTKDKVAKLPAVIDYAAGSGHFLTEIMEEYQNIIDELDTNGYSAKAKNEVDAWKINQYSWAGTYVYGIEKDYRLVKVAKIGCYFYGDGLAQVIYGDGLDSFKKSEDYRGLLKENAQEPQFSIVVSNPPYAVNDCKDDLEYLGAQNDFDIYKSLTYSSKEIECLFVERTKHLLKDDGIASIVLPSSILSSTGIYTKTREIILQYFEIIAITELGSNTFMATGTNTVVLFLRKRNEAKINDIKERVYNLAKNYPKTQEDLTLNGIEKPVKKYLDYTGESEIDPEKFYYFVLNYWQKTVLIKTGEKDAEKRFLGYEYSNRRGHEGMHPMQRGKTIEECTKLFNENDFKDETKASSYIYRAFNGDFDFPIHESLKNNISRTRLMDMLAFDRPKFEKFISTAVKKKVKIESKWNEAKFEEIADIIRGVTYSKSDQTLDRTENIVLTADNITLNGHFELKKEIFLYENFMVSEDKRLKKNDIFMCFSSGSKEHLGKVAFIENDTNYLAGGFMGIIRAKSEIEPKYLFQLLNTVLRQPIRDLGSGSNINNLSSVINEIKIPLPPKEIQERIISEIEVLERKEVEVKQEIEKMKNQIFSEVKSVNQNNLQTLESLLFKIDGPTTKIAENEIQKNGQYPVITQEQNVLVSGYTDNDNVITDLPLIVFGDHSCTFKFVDFKFVRGADGTQLIKTDESKILSKFLFYYLQTVSITNSGKYERHFKYLKYEKIPVPPLSDQQKILSKIEKIEMEISKLETELTEIPKEKEAVLKRYLN